MACLNGRGLRQQDRECGPTGLARHTDSAAVMLDDRFGDGKAQATACAFRRACRVDFVKPFEYVRKMLRCDGISGSDPS